MEREPRAFAAGLGVELILVALIQLWPTMPTWVAIGFFLVGAALLAVWPLSLMRERGLVDLSNFRLKKRHSPFSIEFDSSDLRYINNESGLGFGGEYELRRIRIGIRNICNKKLDNFKIFIDEIRKTDGRVVSRHSEASYNHSALPLWNGEDVLLEIASLDISDVQSKIRILGKEYERCSYVIEISARNDDFPPEKKSYKLFIDSSGLLQMRKFNG